MVSRTAYGQILSDIWDNLLPLLEQVIRAATARIENTSLFRELEELTESLDRLVRNDRDELTHFVGIFSEISD